MGVKDVSTRWIKASRALKKEDQVSGQKLAEMAMKRASEAFYALDDPLEAAVFSVLVEMMREIDEIKKARDGRRPLDTSVITCGCFHLHLVFGWLLCHLLACILWKLGSLRPLFRIAFRILERDYLLLDLFNR